MKREHTQGRRSGGRGAHAAWALVCIGLALALVIGGRGGHPPAIVLLPIVLAAWAVGHGLIWATLRLAQAGRRERADASGDPRWPLPLRLTAVGTAVAALVGVVQLLGTVATGEWYPFRHPGEWAAMLVVWLAHGTCFAGLLLRRRWSRHGCAALCAGWAALLGLQAVDGFRSNAADVAGLLVAGALVVLLLLLGTYLVLSSKVRAVLGG